MNKTLLLILCDFLLLTLLALTRWESAEPPRPTQPPAVTDVGANAMTREQDILEAMRASLADERRTREEIAGKLTAADAALAERERNLGQLQTERAKLTQERNAVAATLTETQRTAAELAQKFSAVSQEATLTKEQLAQLQRELAEKQAEADRQRTALARLEQQQADARKQISTLTMGLVLAEEQKKTALAQAQQFQKQAEVERGERIKVQETATQLAAGVGQLAEKSGELTREIRDHRPINANTLFNDYLANRVTANFTGTRRVLLGSPARTKEASTVLVTDGRQVYALLHVADTIFALAESGGVDWESLRVELARGGHRTAPGAVNFLAHDPRVVALPVEPSEAMALGAKIYPLAADPFRFPEAILIDGGGRGYGEVSFKLDPADPNFVRVDNRFFKRLVGHESFKPKSGDLVFAKSGELLGIMVNKDYCALLKNFAAARAIQPGADIKAQNTGALLTELGARVRAMPLAKQ